MTTNRPKNSTDTIGPYYGNREGERDANLVAEAALADCASNVRIIRSGPYPHVYHVEYETTPFFIGRHVDAVLSLGPPPYPWPKEL